MKSLAEHLGIPAGPGQPATPSRRTGVKEFCRGILESEDYRVALRASIILGELPPNVHVLLYHYAYGKPVEHVKFEDVSKPLEALTADQLEERALRLAELARRIRMNEADSLASEDEPPGRDPSSIH